MRSVGRVGAVCFLPALAAVATASFVIALFSWHRQRLIRDRIAAERAASVEAGPSH